MQKKTLLFNPAPSDGGGQGAGMSVLGDVTGGAGGGEGGGQGQGQGAPGGQPPAGGAAGGQPPAHAGAGSAPAPHMAPTMTPDQIAKLAADTVAQMQRTQQPQPQPRQYTQEEFDKMFNVFRVNPQHITSILAGGEQAVAAFNEIIPGIVKQAVTMAVLERQQALEEFEQSKLKGRFDELDQIRQDYLERQGERVKKQFFDKYPELQNYEPMVIAFGTQLQQQGFQGTTDQAFEQVANLVKTTLAKAGVQLAAGGGQSAKQQPQGQQHQMASLSAPGGGGGGGSGGSAKPKSAGLAALS